MSGCTSAWCAPAPERAALRARRRLLLAAAAWTGLAGLPVRAAADERAAFDARSADEALQALGAVPAASARIELELPELAEDGAFVPLSVSSALPGTREILIVVDGNPQPLAASFTIPEGTEPYVATRIRMAGSGSVLALVRTDAGLFVAARSARVVRGGCG